MLGPLFSFFQLLALAVLVVQVWALIDAVMRPGPAYVAADKQTKNTWLAILGLTVAVNLLFGGGVFGGGFLGLFTLIGLIAALVYLVDVRPAVRQFGRGGSSSGPYGPW